MQTEENNQQPKSKSTDFFEKKEMNTNIDDKDNAGDDSFTPIYLTDNVVLQTPQEKKHDESVNLQKNDTVEAINIDSEETIIDKMNEEERNGIGE